MGKVKTTLVKNGSVFKRPFDKYRALEEHKKAKTKAIFYGVAFGVLLLVLVSIALMSTFYDEKAAPATFLANHDVTGKNYYEVKEIAKDLIKKAKMDITYDNIMVTAGAAEMGIELDADATARAVIDKGKTYVALLRYNPLVRKDVEIVTNQNIGIFQQFLDEKFDEKTKPVVEPSVTYNETTRAFMVTPGQSGQIISAEDLKSDVTEVLSNPKTMSVKVELSEGFPIVSDKNAEIARDYMNERLSLRLNMNHDGRLMYFIDPPDIASFAVFTPNRETNMFDVDFSDEKIKIFIDSKLAPSLSGAPVNERLLVDKDGNVLMVINKGRNGLAPHNLDALISKIKQALTDNVILNADLDLTEKEFTVERIVTEDNKWIEYNLSTYTVTLWNGSQAIWSTNQTAQGKPSTPSLPAGIYRVYAQTFKTCMPNTPDPVPLCDIHYVTYFGWGGYAFHEAWWMGNRVHQNISHGCINMRQADAKVVYDFAEVGTRVVVTGKYPWL